MSASAQLAKLILIRDAITDAMVAGDATVKEYEVAGKRVSRDPIKALREIEERIDTCNTLISRSANGRSRNIFKTVNP